MLDPSLSVQTNLFENNSYTERILNRLLGAQIFFRKSDLQLINRQFIRAFINTPKDGGYTNTLFWWEYSLSYPFSSRPSLPYPPIPGTLWEGMPPIDCKAIYLSTA